MEIIDATGKAKCQVCGKTVSDGKQVKAPLGSMYNRSYHLKCFKDQYWGFIHDLYNLMSDAEGDDLNQS